MTSTRTSRKARKKATTDLGRSILQRERQKLAREQAVLAEKEAADNASKRAAQKHAQKHRKDNTAAVFARSIVRRAAGVLASEGVVASISTEALPANRSVQAWTDFHRIHVGYHVYEDDVKLTAAVLRGLFYHEGGHCRFSLPYLDLVDAASENLRTRVAGMDVSSVHKAWNALEDQRMETAVVSDSPRKAGYFTPVILEVLASDPMSAAANYPLMIWRRYLPARVRKGARTMFLAFHGGGADALKLEADFRRVTTNYVLGTDADTLLTAVIEMEALLKRHQVAFDLSDQGAGHQKQYRRGSGKPDMEIPVDPSMHEDGDDGEGAEGSNQPGEGEGQSKGSKGQQEGDDEGKGAPVKREVKRDTPGRDAPTPTGQASGAHDGDDAGLTEGDTEGDDGDSDADEGAQDGNSAGSSGSHDDEDEGLTQDDLDEALAEAEDKRLEDKALDQDVQAFQDALDTAESALMPYVGGIDVNPGHLGEAQTLAENLKRAFETATADLTPSWHEQQRRGILNVNRYVTRSHGDVEFFRDYVDNGQPGCDIAVSLLLDYSGSMGGVTEGLAKTAYACKVACQDLGIPCTVLLWDTDARVLWDSNERAEHLPLIQAMGGTDPQKALADLDNHNLGEKSKHLVMIMTDDGWSSGAPSMASYKQDGRTIIGLGYGGYSGSIASSMLARGADEAFSIDDLAEIPQKLEQALVALT